mgnify:CR=1 FL=1
MIVLDKNYSITTDSTHGFNLLYTSDPVVKAVKGVAKEVISKDIWYYPKLSLALLKYFSLSAASESQQELIENVKRIEDCILSFSNTFSKQGKTFNI